METLIYNVSQFELYKISRLGWRNFNLNLLEFSSFNLHYNQHYFVNCMAEIDAAEALPSENIFSSINEDDRILLTRSVDSCLIKWQNLKRYITKAYDAEQSLKMLDVAGQLLYTDASNYNWKSVKLLVNEASAFIKNYKTTLIANENMPPNFGDNFDGTKDVFIALELKVFGPVGDTTQHKQNKIKANNAIFLKLTQMLHDGQQLFINDESVQQQFVFDNLHAIINGMNQSGIRGFVTDAKTGLAINAATISPANHAFVTITDNAGFFNLKLSVGDYLITISAKSYVNHNETVTVKNDMIFSLNVHLTSIAANN